MTKELGDDQPPTDGAEPAPDADDQFESESAVQPDKPDQPVEGDGDSPPEPLQARDDSPPEPAEEPADEPGEAFAGDGDSRPDPDGGEAGSPPEPADQAGASDAAPADEPDAAPADKPDQAASADASNASPADEPDQAPPDEGRQAIDADAAGDRSGAQADPNQQGGSQSPEELAGAAAETDQAPKARPRRRHRALKWSLAVCLALVAAAGGAVAYADHYFADRAAPGATLAGLDVAGQTESELRKTAAALVAGLRFTFTADGETLSNDAKLTGDASQLGVTVDPKAVAADVLSAAKDQPLWRKLNPWTDKPVAVKAEFNAQTVRQFLDAEFISEAQTTSDAAVAFDPEAVAFSVVPAVVGLKTEAEPAIEAMRAHLADTAAPTEVAVKAAPDPPKIDDAAAGAAAAQATEALGRVIGFDNGQDGVRARTYQLPAAVIGGWVAFTPDPARGVIDVSFDQALIAAELPGLLADKVAIAAREHIVMTYPDSDTQIGVVQWGLNGLRMADPAPVAVEVAAALAQGRDAQITVPLETDPFETKQVKPPTNYDEPDGAHWIDVDKSSFTATLYAGTTEVGSYVISIGKPGHDTPSGTFYVYLKYDHQVMRGPASDPYESPTDWVSYFSGGVAFHSAPWNEPNNWRRRVSHGCVNMKTRDAKVVYDFAPIGTKVVVHD